jgi:D-alanine--poly(phosphoribitol) ligase subunit 2
MEREQALRLVFEAIDQVNQQLPAAKRLAKKPDTVIVGPGGPLDSLGIVTFVIALEETLGDDLSRSVQRLDESALSDAEGPFHTVDSLVQYLLTVPVA